MLEKAMNLVAIAWQEFVDSFIESFTTFIISIPELPPTESKPEHPRPPKNLMKRYGYRKSVPKNLPYQRRRY